MFTFGFVLATVLGLQYELDQLAPGGSAFIISPSSAADCWPSPYCSLNLLLFIIAPVLTG